MNLIKSLTMYLQNIQLILEHGKYIKGETSTFIHHRFSNYQILIIPVSFVPHPFCTLLYCFKEHFWIFRVSVKYYHKK